MNPKDTLDNWSLYTGWEEEGMRAWNFKGKESNWQEDEKSKYLVNKMFAGSETVGQKRLWQTGLAKFPPVYHTHTLYYTLVPYGDRSLFLE